MHLLSTMLWVGLVVALPQLPANESTSLIATNSFVPAFPSFDKTAKIAVRNLTADDVHNNVMKTHPANYIVKSDSLHQYLGQNLGTNHTIYLSDERTFVSMSSVTAKAGSGKRASPCYGYTQTYTKQTQSWWDSWIPIGTDPKCLYNGKNSKTATLQMAYSKTTTITENAGLEWGVIKDVLTASIGFSVATSFTDTATWACTIPAYSVGQIWGQSYIAWGWFWSKPCFSCDYGGYCYDEYVNGGATAPSYLTNKGCSTGYDNVQC